TATFTKPGNYDIQVYITDAEGLRAIRIVTVTVNATLTTVTVAPASTSVTANGTQQFTASGKDQFGTALSPQPTFTWSTSGGGTISSSGLFTAGPNEGGPFTITASSGGVSGNASVSVNGNAPTVSMPASASPSPAIGSTTSLSVLGADDGGEASLTYTW